MRGAGDQVSDVNSLEIYAKLIIIKVSPARASLSFTNGALRRQHKNASPSSGAAARAISRTVLTRRRNVWRTALVEIVNANESI